ncbi:MAG: hypothetical protein ACRERU_23605, partial [Methylococcales bacterium]
MKQPGFVDMSERKMKLVLTPAFLKRVDVIVDWEAFRPILDKARNLLRPWAHRRRNIIRRLGSLKNAVPNGFLKSAFVRDLRRHFDREFDPEFFRQRYGHLVLPNFARRSDRDDALFLFYLTHVRGEFLDLNRRFSEKDYLALNRDVKTAVDKGDYVSGFHHWVLHGRDEKRRCRGVAQDFRNITPGRNAVQVIFDADYYVWKLMETTNLRIPKEEALDHFWFVGLKAGIVPVPITMFDEEFYITYYDDVRYAKLGGYIPSGYYHYVHGGMTEGRIPTHDLPQLLEAKLGELNRSVGLQTLDGLRHRLKPVPMKISPRRSRRIWNIFIPSLDPDIMFGGYIDFLNFLCRLAENNNELRFLVMEDGQSNREWFLREIASEPRWLKAFAG